MAESVADWVSTGFETAGTWLAGRLERLTSGFFQPTRTESRREQASPPPPAPPADETDDNVPSLTIRDQMLRLFLGFAGVLLWDKCSKTLSAYGIFNFVFWYVGNVNYKRPTSFVCSTRVYQLSHTKNT